MINKIKITSELLGESNLDKKLLAIQNKRIKKI